MPLYFLALIALFSTALPKTSFAIDQIYNWNGLEFRRAGNVHVVQPSTPESTRLRGGWVLDISDVEPKSNASHALPYQHKGAANSKLTVGWPIDTKKVADAASKAAGAAAAGASTGNGYVAVASVACAFVCEPLIQMLVDSGLDQFKQNSDGSLSVEVPDPNSSVVISDGFEYQVAFHPDYPGPWSASPLAACQSGVAAYGLYGATFQSFNGVDCYLKRTAPGWGDTMHAGISKRINASCPSGSRIVNGVCGGSSPTTSQPLGTYLQSNYMGNGWSNHWAALTAGIVASGVNVFTDGTGTTITGPAIVPISTSETKTPVNLQPGTTTPVTPGHTGPTDSGTQTTTKTTTANNTYRPGSSSSGPSMETKTQTTTTTNITNNITNTTSTTIINETTESDESPKEEEKDFCEKNPDSLACAELDTPEGEVPRDTIEIDFEPEDLGLGSGVCPPDRPIDSLTVFSYQPTCDVLDTYAYPLTILLASFGALLIIFVGKAEA